MAYPVSSVSAEDIIGVYGINNAITSSQLGRVNTPSFLSRAGIHLYPGSQARVEGSDIFSNTVGIQSANANLTLKNSRITVELRVLAFGATAYGLYLDDGSSAIARGTMVRVDNVYGTSAIGILTLGGSTILANTINVTASSSFPSGLKVALMSVDSSTNSTSNSFLTVEGVNASITATDYPGLGGTRIFIKNSTCTINGTVYDCPAVTP